MARLAVTFPELVLVAGTRALGGIGVGLLLAGRLNTQQRRTLGIALLGVGVLTTIPLAGRILPRVRRDRAAPPEVRSIIEADVT